MQAEPKTVLVAEDDDLIRLLSAEALREAGFKVVEAGDADQALLALNTSPESILLLFTDIHMPGQMDGLELAHHVSEHWPHIALIVTSGALNPALDELPADTVFLPKPYDVGHVTKHVYSLTHY